MEAEYTEHEEELLQAKDGSDQQAVQAKAEPVSLSANISLKRAHTPDVSAQPPQNSPAPDEPLDTPRPESAQKRAEVEQEVTHAAGAATYTPRATVLQPVRERNQVKVKEDKEEPDSDPKEAETPKTPTDHSTSSEEQRQIAWDASLAQNSRVRTPQEYQPDGPSIHRPAAQLQLGRTHEELHAIRRWRIQTYAWEYGCGTAFMVYDVLRLAYRKHAFLNGMDYGETTSWLVDGRRFLRDWARTRIEQGAQDVSVDLVDATDNGASRIWLWDRDLFPYL